MKWKNYKLGIPMKKEYVVIHVAPLFKNESNEERVLLIMKDKPEWQKGFFNLVGGKVEDGETPEQAALRELKEETGYSPHHHYYNHATRMGVIDAFDGLIHCFFIPVDDYIQKEPKPRDGE